MTDWPMFLTAEIIAFAIFNWTRGLDCLVTQKLHQKELKVLGIDCDSSSAAVCVRTPRWCNIKKLRKHILLGIVRLESRHKIQCQKVALAKKSQVWEVASFLKYNSWLTVEILPIIYKKGKRKYVKFFLEKKLNAVRKKTFVLSSKLPIFISFCYFSSIPI